MPRAESQLSQVLCLSPRLASCPLQAACRQLSLPLPLPLLLLPNSRRVTLKSFQCARCQAQEMTMGQHFRPGRPNTKYAAFTIVFHRSTRLLSHPTDSPGHAKYLRKVNLPWLTASFYLSLPLLANLCPIHLPLALRVVSRSCSPNYAENSIE